MEDIRFETENDLKVIVKNEKEEIYNEDCCTCINIVMKNDGQILTSFLGSHNPYIVRQLEKAQKIYFKELKKALKVHYLKGELPACDCGDDCHCNDEHDCGCHNADCTCGDNCECTPEHNCGCMEHNEEKCSCGDDCKCTPENHCGCYDKKTAKKATKKTSKKK